MAQKVVLLVLALFALGGIGLLLLSKHLSVASGPTATLALAWNFGQVTASISDQPTQVELTVYSVPSTHYFSSSAPLVFDPSEGVALVKERRRVDLASGLNQLALSNVAAHLSPGSVQTRLAQDPQARVLEQNYQYDLVSAHKLLERYLDQTVTVRAENRTYSGLLLSVSPVILKTTSGIKLFSQPPEFETLPALAEGLITKPTLTWKLGTTQTGPQDLELSYLTSGLSWSAEYVAVVNPEATQVDLTSWVSVRNDAGIPFKDASLNLVAGQVNLVQNRPTYYPRYESAAVAQRTDVSNAAAPQFNEQSLFEYRVYTLERTTTLANGETKQIELFHAPQVSARKELVFDASRSQKVQVNVEFENKLSTGLGRSLPAGIVRVYQPDAAGHLQFLGEDSMEHTPENEKARLFVGNAFDLTAKHESSDYEEVSKCVVRQSYTVTLRNAKTDPATIKVVDHAYGEWSITQETKPHVKESAYTFYFLVPVPAKGESTLNYTVEQRDRYC